MRLTVDLPEIPGFEYTGRYERMAAGDWAVGPEGKAFQFKGKSSDLSSVRYFTLRPKHDDRRWLLEETNRVSNVTAGDYYVNCLGNPCRWEMDIPSEGKYTILKLTPLTPLTPLTRLTPLIDRR